MFKILQIRPFALLWGGQVGSMIGDWVLFAALPVFVYQATGSSLATGTMFVVQVLARLLLGSLAGVYVDRWDNRRIMIVSDLLRAMVLPLLFLVESMGWLWVIYLVGFVEAAVSQFAYPAERALIPRLVGVDRLGEANSLYAVGSNVARVAGPSIGGALMATVGLPVVVVVDCATYLLSALTVSLIQLPPRDENAGQAPENADAPAARASVWADLIDGIRIIRTHPGLIRIFAVVGLAMVGDAVLSPLFVVFCTDILKAGPQAFGWLLTARGAGGIVGGLIIGQLSRRIAPHRLIAIGLLLTGLMLLTVVNLPYLWFALLSLLLIGIPASAWMITTDTALQMRTPERYRGRIFGAYGTVTALAMIIGSIAGGGLGDLIGTVPTLNLAAFLTVSAGVLAVVLLRDRAASPPMDARVSSDQ